MTRGAHVCKWASFSPGCSPRQHLTSGRELMTTIFLRRLLHHHLLLFLLPLPRPLGKPRLPSIVFTAVIRTACGSLLFCFCIDAYFVWLQLSPDGCHCCAVFFFGSDYLPRASADSCPISFPSYMFAFYQSKERIRFVEKKNNPR